RVVGEPDAREIRLAVCGARRRAVQRRGAVGVPRDARCGIPEVLGERRGGRGGDRAPQDGGRRGGAEGGQAHTWLLMPACRVRVRADYVETGPPEADVILLPPPGARHARPPVTRPSRSRRRTRAG